MTYYQVNIIFCLNIWPKSVCAVFLLSSTKDRCSDFNNNNQSINGHPNRGWYACGSSRFYPNPFMSFHILRLQKQSSSAPYKSSYFESFQCGWSARVSLGCLWSQWGVRQWNPGASLPPFLSPEPVASWSRGRETRVGFLYITLAFFRAFYWGKSIEHYSSILVAFSPGKLIFPRK